MRITSRTKAIAFFITLGACLVGLAIFLNVSWIVYHWRSVFQLVLGIIFFSVIIAGLVVNTIFLVREIRRNEQQDSFLNAVTHELKTPIASIRLYLETLESRQLAEAQRHDFYRIMLEDTNRLLSTVEQVLKAGEARHRSTRKIRKEVDFSELVRNSLELARLRHNLKPQELRFSSPPPDNIAVLGSSEDLSTAVSNLLDNAVKYSGSKKDVQLEVLTPNMDNVLLLVRDQGIGIPRTERKRIFKRFYRVQDPKTGQVKGTGLGLFIVRSVAESHGGDISVESDGENLGSTFTLRLPRIYRA
jgi:signal transduction histidine kinase